MPTFPRWTPQMHRKVEEFTPEAIDAHLGEALNRLVSKDALLFAINVNERSLTFRLALYLAALFPDFDVDCEYNRHHTEVKRLRDVDLHELAGRTPPLEDEDGLTVFPDIIVHRRGTAENLLVLEIKKTTSNVKEEFDLAKLRAYRQELGYRFAKFIRLGTGGKGDLIDLIRPVEE